MRLLRSAADHAGAPAALRAFGGACPGPRRSLAGKGGGEPSRTDRPLCSEAGRVSRLLAQRPRPDTGSLCDREWAPGQVFREQLVVVMAGSPRRPEAEAGRLGPEAPRV